jgi:hypothetical protein
VPACRGGPRALTWPPALMGRSWASKSIVAKDMLARCSDAEVCAAAACSVSLFLCLYVQTFAPHAVDHEGRGRRRRRQARAEDHHQLEGNREASSSSHLGAVVRCLLCCVRSALLLDTHAGTPRPRPTQWGTSVPCTTIVPRRGVPEATNGANRARRERRDVAASVKLREKLLEKVILLCDMRREHAARRVQLTLLASRRRARCRMRTGRGRTCCQRWTTSTASFETYTSTPFSTHARAFGHSRR